MVPRLLGVVPVGHRLARRRAAGARGHGAGQSTAIDIPASCPGGQQQRVGVARALAARPSVLLMDEPFGALDPITRDQMQDELKTLQGALGLTVVLVTHDMTEALLLADRIAVMQGGAVVGVGTPAELMSDPGHDYVRTLMAMPKRQADRVERIARGAS